MGTGMSFPREVFEGVNLASGDLAEDLVLGLQLATAGHLPLLCPQAVVRSEFPVTAEVVAIQRKRWEHGHLTIIATRLFSVARTAVRRRSWRLLALTLDAAVPPLVLLGLLIVATLATSGLVLLSGGGVAPLIASVTALIFLSGALAAAWMKSGRDLLTLKVLTALIPYVAGKFAIYASAFASNKKWERTGRDKPR
jgi:cellulose synthase/poly-beta-1,6-N-acetylglucosamine synthase-like glycosyltransferase